MVMYTPAKMIVLRNPDKAVSVGVSATAASMMGRPDHSNRNNDGKGNAREYVNYGELFLAVLQIILYYEIRQLFRVLHLITFRTYIRMHAKMSKTPLT
jgi:hypothetical protein